MSLSSQPYKGTRDFYPEQFRLQKWIFETMRSVAESFGYEEYNGPLLESFDIYAAKTGEEIVEKQLYWFMDRGERKVAIRPEMTPTLARMVAAKLKELPTPIRWFSLPNLWRYERPQKGRLREHWQLNLDVLGGDFVFADAEILKVAMTLMRAFGGEKHVCIKTNHRALADYFFKDGIGLDAPSAMKLVKAVDAKDKIGEEAYHKWLDEIGVNQKSRQRIDDYFKMNFSDIVKAYPCPGAESLKKLYSILGVSPDSGTIVFDPSIMRGLDYYTGTVFEMYDVSPENRRAMFGGGRYDNLIGLFGKQQISGAGFGMGDVTMADFLSYHKLLPTLKRSVDVFITLPEGSLKKTSDEIADSLRKKGVRAATALEVGPFSKQLKQANRHGARFAVLLGDSEIKEKKVALKDLQTGKQEAVAITDLTDYIVKSL